MDNIKVLVIEDEEKPATKLLRALKKMGYDTVGPAKTLEEAFGLFYTHKPDIAIVDIMLSGQPDGIEFVRVMNGNPSHRKPAIFLSSMTDRGIFDQAKASGPYGYLVKPFRAMELGFAIEMAIEKFLGEGEGVFANGKSDNGAPTGMPSQDCFFVKHGAHFVKINCGDISHIKVDGKYCDIVTTKGRYVIQFPLKELAERLPDFFMKVHRSYIINLHHLRRMNLQEGELIMENKDSIPVSRRYRDELMEHFDTLS